MTDAAPQQLFELWKRQFEDGMQAWSRLVGSATPAAPLDAAAVWRPIIEQTSQAWAHAFAQAPVSPDLIGQWKQFLDQSIDAWSRVLGQAMATETFAQQLGRTLDQWLLAAAPVKKATEQSIDTVLQSFNLASRSQLTGIARQIVELDERIEHLEDRLTTVLRKLDEVARAVTSRPAREPA
jgi:hypothetical protein